MPKSLPSKDFRAKRIVLTRSDFAYAPKPVPPASDVVDKPTWQSIVTLPDDVAVRTSNYHGTKLKQLNDLWGAWVESYGSQKDDLFFTMLDAADDFQAATYTVMTGYYRLSITALRSALELTTIGTWAQICGKGAELRQWKNGEKEISFGRACDGLSGATDVLRTHLRTVENDSLFDQKTTVSEGGVARRIYSGVSNFSHSRPGSTDGDMRRSNGPIYVRSAFEHVAWIQTEIIGFCFVLLLLARPKLKVPLEFKELFEDPTSVRSRVTRAAFEELCRARS